jgi:hypothetical protein
MVLVRSGKTYDEVARAYGEADAVAEVRGSGGVERGVATAAEEVLASHNHVDLRKNPSIDSKKRRSTIRAHGFVESINSQPYLLIYYCTKHKDV